MTFLIKGASVSAVGDQNHAVTREMVQRVEFIRYDMAAIITREA
jgi:hypothetical protein